MSENTAQPESDVPQTTPAVEEKLTHIYALVDPRDWKPFYVGKANTPSKRLWQHTSRGHESSRQNQRKIDRIVATPERPTRKPALWRKSENSRQY